MNKCTIIVYKLISVEQFSVILVALDINLGKSYRFNVLAAFISFIHLVYLALYTNDKYSKNDLIKSDPAYFSQNCREIYGHGSLILLCIQLKH